MSTTSPQPADREVSPAAPNSLPMPAPCPPWCTVATHLVVAWETVSPYYDRLSEKRGFSASQSCQAEIGRVGWSRHGQPRSEYRPNATVTVCRYQSYDYPDSAAPEADSAAIKLDLDTDEELTPEAARKLAGLLLSAADTAEQTVVEPANGAAGALIEHAPGMLAGQAVGEPRVGCPGWCTAHTPEFHRSRSFTISGAGEKGDETIEVYAEQFAPTAEEWRADGGDGEPKHGPILLAMQGLPHPTGTASAEDLSIAVSLRLAQAIAQLCALVMASGANGQPGAGPTDPEPVQQHRPWCVYKADGGCRDIGYGQLLCVGDDHLVRPSHQREGRTQRPISAYLQRTLADETLIAVEPEDGPDGWELIPAEAVEFGFYLLSIGLEAQGEPMVPAER